MYKQLISKMMKPLLKSLFAIGLVVTLALSNADGALAARSGGRIGGGSFGAPARSYSSPSRTYAPSGGGYYPGGYGGGFGGGFGFPFLLPFFGFGGGFGGLFSILIFISIANFLVQSFRSARGGTDELGNSVSSTTVSVARLQVGLLAEARTLQAELDSLARTADTDTAVGRAQVLQESTLAMLRHPEYWVYAGAESMQTRLEAAEAKFNQFSLAERSKFTEETLSNYNNQLRQAGSSNILPGLQENGALVASDLNSAPGEFIVVTVIVGTQGKLELPVVKNSEDLRQALRQIGGVSSEQLLAVEVLWTPQANGDTLTADDMLAGYPDLRLI
ncbi:MULTISPECIES: DUF1517 domain-containing protein [unclassified Microcoleus]|uniref:DUF1517 domain-containing protein n=1 Tax=unclassified Microcoleus TaxID=2642155 RepID=UPI002FD3865F